MAGSPVEPGNWGADGHIKTAENIVCASHREACATASDRQGDFPAIEVWLGTRRVTRIGAPELIRGPGSSRARGSQ